MPFEKLAIAETKGVLTSLKTMDGKCQKFIVGSKEQTCEDFVIQSEYNNGGTGFWFSTNDENSKLIIFSGWVQDQVVLESKKIKQPINRLITFDSSELVEGLCTYGDLESGVSKIECKAVNYNGNIFRGIFITDGKPPKNLN